MLVGSALALGALLYGLFRPSPDAPEPPSAKQLASARPAEPSAPSANAPARVTDRLTAALLAQRPAPPQTPAERAARALRPHLEQCFEDARAHFPPPQRVVVSVTLEGAKARGELVASTIQDPRVRACFEDALAETRFEPPAGDGPVPVLVKYPFDFGDGAPDAG